MVANLDFTHIKVNYAQYPVSLLFSQVFSMTYNMDITKTGIKKINKFKIP
jgi:hypothetical protein